MTDPNCTFHITLNGVEIQVDPGVVTPHGHYIGVVLDGPLIGHEIILPVDYVAANWKGIDHE